MPTPTHNCVLIHKHVKFRITYERESHRKIFWRGAAAAAGVDVGTAAAAAGGAGAVGGGGDGDDGGWRWETTYTLSLASPAVTVRLTATSDMLATVGSVDGANVHLAVKSVAPVSTRDATMPSPCTSILRFPVSVLVHPLTRALSTSAPVMSTLGAGNDDGGDTTTCFVRFQQRMREFGGCV